MIYLKDSLGAACTFSRNFTGGERWLNEALAAAEKDEDLRARASVLNNRGILRAAGALEGNAGEAGYGRKAYRSLSPEETRKSEEAVSLALADFTAAQDLAEKADDALLAARAGGNAAFTALRARSHEQGASGPDGHALFVHALNRITTLPDSHEKAYLLIGAGRVGQALLAGNTGSREADAAASNNSYLQALRIAEKIQDPRAQSFALGYQGALYDADAQPDAALSLTRHATFIAQQAGLPDALYLWQWQTGRLLHAKGDLEGAIGALGRAVTTLQNIRVDIATGLSGSGNGSPRTSYRDEVGPLYFEFEDLLLNRARQAADSRDGPAEAEALNRTRDAVELLKQAEMDDYFRERCRPRPGQISPIEAGTAVVYLIPLPDRTELLIDTSSGLHRFSAQVPGASLDAEAVSFRRQLETRTTRRYLHGAARIYDWLIRPIEPQLSAWGIHTLVFVPDGELLNIPFAALHDGQSFLVARYAVAVAPGLGRLDRAQASPGAAVSAPRQFELLCAGMSEPRGSFPALQYVPEELASLRHLFGGTQLLDSTFNVSALTSAVDAAPYSVLHLASHGRFGNDVRETFILTGDPARDMGAADLERMLLPYRFRARPLELLTLSACETAAGDDYRAALGLAGIGIKCGARSSLASLWAVNDSASVQLMTDFYTTLKNDSSASRAEALRRAQVKLLSDARYRHPRYWAPYLLIGNWQ